jgi:hypothetical protein
MFWILKRKPFPTGLLPDPRPPEEKEKDYLTSEILTAQPLTWLDFEQWKSQPEIQKMLNEIPVYDQNGAGSCVAHSIALIATINNWKEEGKAIKFSARGIYARRQNKPQPGMYFQNAAELFKTYGVVFESVLPSEKLTEEKANDLSDYLPSFDLVGKIYAPKNYFWVNSFDEVVQVISRGIPVKIGVRFTDEEWDFVVPQIKVQATSSLDLKYAHSIVCLQNSYFIYQGKRAVLIQDSWGCYDKDTEILTENGWKLFKDLTGEEKVATLNPKNLTLEYHRILEKQVYDYDGYLWHYKARDVDLLVTPNHKLFIKPQQKPWMLIEADKIWIKTFKMKKDANWVGEEKEYFVLGDYKIKMDDWLEFLGYYISEGNCDKWTIKIAATKPEIKEKIRENLKKLPFHFKENKNGFCVSSGIILNKEKKKHFVKRKFSVIIDYLKKLGKSHQKYIPQEYKNLSKRQLKILFDALMVGDGSYSKCVIKKKNGKVYNSQKVTYYTSSRRLADDIQELVLKIGYAADITFSDRRGRIYEASDGKGKRITRFIEYRIEIKRKELSPTASYNWKPELVPYKGKVYCVTVPNHIIYVRRNGKAVWSGNSRGWNGRRILTEDWFKFPRFIGGLWYEDMNNLSVFNQNLPKPKYKFKRQLTTGMRGEDVAMLQVCLATLQDSQGYLFPLWQGQEPTGVYGGLTRAGVKRFQAMYGLEQTGSVNQPTLQKLNEVFG